MAEITTLEEFRQIKNGNPDHIIVILDTANENKSHFVGCEFITEENFQEKVLDNANKNGRYYHYTNRQEARRAHDAFITPCGRCNANLVFINP